MTLTNHTRTRIPPLRQGGFNQRKYKVRRAIIRHISKWLKDVEPLPIRSTATGPTQHPAAAIIIESTIWDEDTGGEKSRSDINVKELTDTQSIADASPP